MHLEVRRAGDCLITSRQQAVTAFTHMVETIVADLPEAVKTNRRLLALGMIERFRNCSSNGCCPTSLPRPTA
ncbi:hypothetical protein ACFQX6_30835 [Streptosporangium lutulentum]